MHVSMYIICTTVCMTYQVYTRTHTCMHTQIRGECGGLRARSSASERIQCPRSRSGTRRAKKGSCLGATGSGARAAPRILRVTDDVCGGCGCIPCLMYDVLVDDVLRILFVCACIVSCWYLFLQLSLKHLLGVFFWTKHCMRSYVLCINANLTPDPTFRPSIA